MYVLAIVASLLLIGNGLGQDCNTLDIETDVEQPISGASLKYCKTDQPQCCNDAYFMQRRSSIMDSVKDDIKDQIENQVGSLDNIVNGVEKALKEDFIPQFSRNYCGPVEGSYCTEAIKDPLSQLLANLVISKEDVEDHDDDDNDDDHDDDDDHDHDHDDDDHEDEFTVHGAVNDLVNATVHLLFNHFVKPKLGSDLPAGTLTCIRNSLTVRESELKYLQANLTQIRRAVTALMHLRTYVKETAVPKFLAVPPTNTCIDAFITARCKACYDNITETCRGACNALMFGCIVPYAAGLRDQFDSLWNSTSRIVQITNKLLYDTGRLPHSLFNVNITDSAALTQMLNEKCNLGLAADGTKFFRKRDEGSNDHGNHDHDDEYKLPSDIDKNSTSLINSGAFGNNKAPKTCMKYMDMNCWNGTHEVAMNNVQLNVDNIDQLIANSPFAGQYDTDELETASESFEPLITNYLKSDSFATVAPEGLFDTGDEGGDGDNNSGSATILAHLSIIMMCLIAYFIF